MKISWVSVAAVALLAGRALAEPVEIGEVAAGAVYYNRPGASLADHNADLSACIADAASPDGPKALGLPLLDTYMNYLIWSGPIAGLAAGKIENCIIVRGWRAVRLPPAEGAELAALKGPELAAAIEPWIGSATPHGDVVRTFANEAAHPTGYKTASRATPPAKTQLSLKLYSEGAAPPPPYQTPPGPATLDPKWPVKALKLTELASAPAGSALIVVRATGVSNRWGTGVGFARVGATPDARPSRDDQAPDALYAGTGTLFSKKEGNWFVLAVPPGRWRISGSGFVNYCLGSPSFEVKAGEVVYAGTFHLEGDDLGPDLTLDPAKAYLGGAAANPVRAAVYRNGSRGSCRGIGVIYALEIPGAPFEPGYAWGGAAKTP